MELTCTNVRYLLTIYHLSQIRLEVSRASVTSMMGVLTEKELVAKERYGKVHLTRSGIRLAKALSAQADELARDLAPRMGLSVEEAWKAACAAVSELPHRCFPAVPAAAPLPA